MATALPQDTASFIVRFVPTDPRNLKTFVTNDHAREEFWRSTAQIDPDKVDIDISLCETRFLQTFATRLRDNLTARLRTREGTVEDRGTKLAQLNLPGSRRLRITIESHEYGSLEAKLFVDGATTIATAFSGRMDLFTAFVEQYTPQVFVASLPIDPVSERPVSATLLAANDLEKAQFKAVLDDLAKKKSTGQNSAALTQGSNHVATAPSNTNPNQTPQRQSRSASAAAAPSSASQTLPTASSLSSQLPGSEGSLSSTGEKSEEPSSIVPSSESAALRSVAPEPIEPAPGRMDVRHFEDRPNVSPQIIMMPQPFVNPTPVGSQDKGQRSNLLWVVANLSLLFPVLLALIVLYFTHSGLQAERAQIAARQLEIEKREKELQQLMQARERQLFEVLHPGAAQAPASSLPSASRAGQ